MQKETWDGAIQKYLKKHKGLEGYMLSRSAESEELDKFVTSPQGQTALELLVVSLVNTIDLEGLDDSLDGYVFSSRTGGFAIDCRGQDFISRADLRPVSTREVVVVSEISAKEIIDYIVSKLDKIADKAKEK